MLNRKQWVVAMLIGAILALLLANAIARAQAVTPQRYLPVIRANPLVAHPPVSIQVLQDITFPFDVYGAVEPIAVQDSTGLWYIAIYRLGGSNTGHWVVTWQEGSNTVTPIGLIAPATFTDGVALQDVPISNSRGSVAYNYNQTAAYTFSWQDTGSGTRRPLLRVAKIVGFVP